MNRQRSNPLNGSSVITQPNTAGGKRKNEYVRPTIPIHPGDILREELAESGVTAAELAQAVRLPETQIDALLNENEAMTPDIAIRLEKWSGASAEFWLGLQHEYNLDVVRRDREHDGYQIVMKRVADISAHDTAAPETGI